MERVVCATVLDVVGDLSSGILHSPHRRGIEAMPFPIPLPRGPLQQQEKNSKRAARPSLSFLYTGHSLCKQAWAHLQNPVFAIK